MECMISAPFSTVMFMCCIVHACDFSLLCLFHNSRLSSVLKHKKPPKRGTMGGGVGVGSGTSRKSSKNEVGLEMHGLMGESSGTGADLVLPPTRGKWNGPPKGSFLAGLHPSRWGRSSSMGPDRPYPALVCITRRTYPVNLNSKK